MSNVNPIARSAFNPPVDPTQGADPGAPPAPVAKDGEAGAFAKNLQQPGKPGVAGSGSVAEALAAFAKPQIAPTGAAVPPQNVRFAPGTNPVTPATPAQEAAALAALRAGEPAAPKELNPQQLQQVDRTRQAEQGRAFERRDPATQARDPAALGAIRPSDPEPLRSLRPENQLQQVDRTRQAEQARAFERRDPQKTADPAAQAALRPPETVMQQPLQNLTPAQTLQQVDRARQAEQLRAIERRDPAQAADPAALGVLRPADAPPIQNALPPPDSFPLRDVFSRLPQRRAVELVFARGNEVAAEILAFYAQKGPAEFAEAVRIFERFPAEARAGLVLELADIGYPALLRATLASVDRQTVEAAVRRFAEAQDARLLLDERAPFANANVAAAVLRNLPPGAALTLVRDAIRAGLPPGDLRILLGSLDPQTREVILKELLGNEMNPAYRALAKALVQKANEDGAAQRALLTRLGLVSGAGQDAQAAIRMSGQVQALPKATTVGALTRATLDGTDEAAAKAIKGIKDPQMLEDIAAAGLEGNAADLAALGLGEAVRASPKGVEKLGLSALESLFASDPARAKRLISDVLNELQPLAAGHVFVPYEDRGGRGGKDGGLGRQADLLNLLRNRSLAGLKAVALERAARKVKEARERHEVGDEAIRPMLERSQLAMTCLLASDPAGIAAFGRDNPELFPPAAMQLVLEEALRARGPAVRGTLAESVARLAGPAVGVEALTTSAPVEGAFGLGYLLAAGAAALRALARDASAVIAARMAAAHFAVAALAGLRAPGDIRRAGELVPEIEEKGDLPSGPAFIAAEAEDALRSGPEAARALPAFRHGLAAFASAGGGAGR